MSTHVTGSRKTERVFLLLPRLSCLQIMLWGTRGAVPVVASRSKLSPIPRMLSLVLFAQRARNNTPGLLTLLVQLFSAHIERRDGIFRPRAVDRRRRRRRRAPSCALHLLSVGSRKAGGWYLFLSDWRSVGQQADRSTAQNCLEGVIAESRQNYSRRYWRFFHPITSALVHAKCPLRFVPAAHCPLCRDNSFCCAHFSIVQTSTRRRFFAGSLTSALLCC